MSNQNSSTQPVHPLRKRMIEDMAYRKLNRHSQSDYLRHVKNFAEFLGRSPEKANDEDLRQFLIWLEEKGTSAATINIAISALSFFFKVTVNQPEKMKLVRRLRLPVVQPDILSPTEVHQLIVKTSKPMYKAIFATAYGAGLRVNEVVSLKVTDIDSERMVIRVQQGKGSRDRQAMLSESLLEALRHWWRIGHRNNVMLPNGWLFPGQNPVNPITTRQVNRVFHAVADSIGIKKKVAMHSLRHAFATHLLESGADIRVIQVLLGHRHLQSTTRYTHLARSTLAAAVNPLDALVKQAKL